MLAWVGGAGYMMISNNDLEISPYGTFRKLINCMEHTSVCNVTVAIPTPHAWTNSALVFHRNTLSCCLECVPV